MDARERSIYQQWLVSYHHFLRRQTADGGFFVNSLDEFEVGTIIIDANVLTDIYTAATWYTGINMHTLAGQPFCDMYALARIMGHYDATHNDVGAACVASDATFTTVMAGDKLYMVRAAHNGVSFGLVPDTSAAILAQNFACVSHDSANLPCTKDIGGTETIIDVSQLTGSAVPGEQLAMSNTWMTDVERNFFSKLFTGGSLNFERSSNNSRSSKRPNSDSRTKRRPKRRNYRKKRRTKEDE